MSKNCRCKSKNVSPLTNRGTNMNAWFNGAVSLQERPQRLNVLPIIFGNAPNVNALWYFPTSNQLNSSVSYPTVPAEF